MYNEKSSSTELPIHRAKTGSQESVSHNSRKKRKKNNIEIVIYP